MQRLETMELESHRAQVLALSVSVSGPHHLLASGRKVEPWRL